MDNSFWMKSVVFVTACTLIVPAPTFATLTDTSLVQESTSAELHDTILSWSSETSHGEVDANETSSTALEMQASAVVSQGDESGHLEKNESTQVLTFLNYDDIPFKVVVEHNRINTEETKKKHEDTCWYIDCEDGNNMLLDIDGEKALFSQMWQAPTVSTTFVYFEKNNTLRSYFPPRCTGQTCENFTENTIYYRLDSTQKPSWIGENENIVWYKKVNNTDGVHIGYALYTDKSNVLYAHVLAFDEVKTFYYNPKTSFKVMMKDGKIDLPTTAEISDLDTCTYYIDCEGKAEVLTVNGEELLFTEPKQGGSTVYFSQANSTLQTVFPQKPQGLSTADFTYDSQNMVKPSWLTDEDRKILAGHTELKEGEKIIGYGIRTKNGKWFYAPKRAGSAITPIDPTLVNPVYKVSFDTDGATAIADQIIPLDGKTTKPTDPNKAGYRFDGWFADKAFKTAFDFTKVITEHTTVYAKWTRITSGGGSSGGGSSGGSSSYTPIQPNTSTEVKGDEAIRLFGTFTGSVHSLIKTLDDPRLKEFMEQYGIPVSQMNVGMTRGEVVKYLVQITKHDVEKLDTSFLKYPDIGTKHAYRKYIAFATKHNIVSGYPDGTFRSHAIISRAELVKILVNAIGYRISEEKTHFADVPASHTLRRYIHTAYIFGLVHGVTKNTFEPNRSVTYGEFSKMMYNILHSK